MGGKERKGKERERALERARMGWDRRFEIGGVG